MNDRFSIRWSAGQRGRCCAFPYSSREVGESSQLGPVSLFRPWPGSRVGTPAHPKGRALREIGSPVKGNFAGKPLRRPECEDSTMEV